MIQKNNMKRRSSIISNVSDDRMSLISDDEEEYNPFLFPMEISSFKKTIYKIAAILAFIYCIIVV
jgi:hypothetical protein